MKKIYLMIFLLFNVFFTYLYISTVGFSEILINQVSPSYVVVGDSWTDETIKEVYDLADEEDIVIIFDKSPSFSLFNYNHEYYVYNIDVIEDDLNFYDGQISSLLPNNRQEIIKLEKYEKPFGSVILVGDNVPKVKEIFENNKIDYGSETEMHMSSTDIMKQLNPNLTALAAPFYYNGVSILLFSFLVIIFVSILILFRNKEIAFGYMNGKTNKSIAATIFKRLFVINIVCLLLILLGFTCYVIYNSIHFGHVILLLFLSNVI